jgi:23S rRNA (uridine2552-2'-O)-methyltransferase
VWRKNQKDDHFYNKAKVDGFRSRSAYKLMDIQNKFKIIQKHSSVIDLGCAPGGWLQVAKRLTDGFVCGIDLQDIQSIPGTHFAQLDFLDSEKVDEFLKSINAPTQFHCIISDMSPKITGDHNADHFESVDLVRSVYTFSLERLKKDSFVVCKLFDGPDTNQLLSEMKSTLSIKIFKPQSSRSESREMFVVGKKGG